MKSRKSLLVGTGCAVLCALCVSLYLVGVQGQVEEARAEALARYGGDQIEVCVAKRDLAPGEVVEENAIAMRLWVADLLPEGAITDPQHIVGQRLGSSVYKGEVLCARRTEVVNAALSVPAGKAAISVPAQAVQAVGGSVEPGMAVDVYATGPAATSQLVQGALVLATSAGAEDASANNAWITLAVDPDRVQEVVAAAQNLALYFVLPAAALPSSPEASDEIAPSGDGVPSGAMAPPGPPDARVGVPPSGEDPDPALASDTDARSPSTVSVAPPQDSHSPSTQE